MESQNKNPAIKQVTRKIPERTRLVLAAITAGRCQFDGCNKFLLEHHVTLDWGNFSQAAHIVAFSEGGPRGDSPDRPEDIHNISNLMLLCPTCHKEIDDHPSTYSVEVLRQHKEAHQHRIQHVTSLAGNHKTTVWTIFGQVRGQKATVSFEDIVEAVSPRYPSTRRPFEIDLSILNEDRPSFLEAARDSIANKVENYVGSASDFLKTGHISLFALARISPLVFLGTKIGNKVPTDLYQHHRDTDDWTWKEGIDPIQFSVEKRQEGDNKEEVAVLLPLSGHISTNDLSSNIRSRYHIYELCPTNQIPNPTLLKTRQDLANFKEAYITLMSMLLQNHNLLDTIDFFPAIPAPVAVVCGQELLPKVHPALRVYEKESSGYVPTITVNHFKQ